MKKRPFPGAEMPKTRRMGADWAAMSIFAVIVIVLTGLSYARNVVWQNDLRLWEDVLRRDPENARAYNALGLAYQHMSQDDLAAVNFDKAIAVDPTYYPAYVNRGVLRGQARLLDKAIEDFNRSIAIDQNYAAAYSNRGIVYALTGQYDKALDDFNHALKLNPALAEVLFNRGRIYFIIGQKVLAVADFQKACDMRYENACGALQQMNQGSNAE